MNLRVELKMKMSKGGDTPVALKLSGSTPEIYRIRGVNQQWGLGQAKREALMPLTPMSLRILHKEVSNIIDITDPVLVWLQDTLKTRQRIAQVYRDASRCNDDRLYSYQKQGVSFLHESQMSLLGDDPRLGKTAQSLIFMDHAVPIEEPIFVFTHKALITHWCSEAEMWCKQHTTVFSLAGMSLKKRDAMISNPEMGGIYVTNWETLRGISTHKRIQNVIGDEVHVVRNRKSKVSNSFQRLRPQRAVLISATMLEKGPQDYYPLLKIIRPTEFGSFWRFVSWYCELVEGTFGTEIGKPINTDLLHDHLAPFSLRRRAADVADMPPKQYEQLVVEAPPALLRLYHEIEKETLVTLSNGEEMIVPNELARFVRLNQVSILPRKFALDINSPKILVIVDYLTNIVSRDIQVVVFVSYRDAAHEIQKQLRERDISTTIFLGGYEDPIDFKSGRTQVLISTPAIGGIGQDYSNADIIIYADLPLSATMLRQSQERTTSVGLQKPRLILSVVCTPLDHKIAAVLKNKQEAITDADILEHILMY